MPTEEIELLTSPIERRLLGRLFVIGGPLGLAVAIMLSLWVSQLYVTNAVTVQAEPRWVAGEVLALRVQVSPESVQGVGPVHVEVAVEQGGQRHALASPTAIDGGGVAQGRVEVPPLSPGPATLHLHIEASPFPAREEAVPIEVVGAREPVAAKHVVSTSMSQYADDGDAQPETLKIDVRPRGRVLAGFDNELMVRVTDPAGRPWSGPLAVRLVDGEIASLRGRAEDPPLLWEGRTDAAGLASLHGELSSEVVRVLVQLREEVDPATPDAGPPKVLVERKVRLVSFAGAVQLTADPVAVAPGGELEVLAAGLGGAKRSVFVDVYGDDGAWVDTFDPPVLGREPAREWSVPARLGGIVQLEAYHFTHDPGESTAVARVLVEEPTTAATLRTGLERQRARLSLTRSDRTWDETRERAYLDALQAAVGGGALPTEAIHSAQRWVLGTLPVEVHGPPTILRTRERDLQALLEHKRAWILGLRIFVFGGGGLYLLAMAVVMLRGHARDADATLTDLQDLAEGMEREQLEREVRQARRATMTRGLFVLVSMAIGLVIAVLALEVLVWEL